MNTTGLLVAAGVEVRIKGRRNLMDLKSYAINGRFLRTGSANWSLTGLKRQDNDIQYETLTEAVERFEKKSGEMWDKAGTSSLVVGVFHERVMWSRHGFVLG